MIQEVIAVDPRFKTAIFYLISNCQPGLKGVKIRELLIKKLAEKSCKRFPA